MHQVWSAIPSGSVFVDIEVQWSEFQQAIINKPANEKEITAGQVG